MSSVHLNLGDGLWATVGPVFCFDFVYSFRFVIVLFFYGRNQTFLTEVIISCLSFSFLFLSGKVGEPVYSPGHSSSQTTSPAALPPLRNNNHHHNALTVHAQPDAHTQQNIVLQVSWLELPPHSANIFVVKFPSHKLTQKEILIKYCRDLLPLVVTLCLWD